MNDKTTQRLKALQARIDRREMLIEAHKDKCNKYYAEQVKLVGRCPKCQNGHYPHCGKKN